MKLTLRHQKTRAGKPLCMSSVLYNIAVIKTWRFLLSPLVLLLAFLAAWLALNLLTLAWWPPFDFNGDEAWILDYVLNTGKSRMMLGWGIAEKGLLLFNTPVYFGYAGLFLKISESVWFLRLSSLLPGLASLVFVYLLARDEGQAWEGLIAVVVLGLSGPFLWTFHYLRGDALTAAMGFSSLWLFTRGARGNPIQAGFGGLLAALSVLAHPAGVVFPLAIFFTGFTVSGWGRKLWLWAGLLAGTLAFLFLNILPNLGGPLLLDVLSVHTSRPALISLFTSPGDIPATVFKILYKPIMLVARGAEYASFFISPILGVLSLCFLFVKSKLRWLWFFLLFSFGLVVMRQEQTNLLFPFIALLAVLLLAELRKKGFGFGPWVLLLAVLPEIYILQGEFRKGRDHLLRRERMIAEVDSLIPPGARVVSSSPALLWGGLKGNYRVFRMADPDYLAGRISLRDALVRHRIGYLVVDIMPAVPMRSYYNIGITERAALGDTSIFEPLGAFPAGYMLHASVEKDNVVDSFRVYRVK